MKPWNCTFAALLALGAVGASTEEANACGGTFCDSGPQAMPVDQTGENILFVMDGTTVEAHVQIQYQGDAERFAWVVPMQKIPEVSVGSQILFQNLLLSTVPTYAFSQQNDTCGGGGGAGGGLSTGGSGGTSSGGSAGSSGGGPSVVFQETVGAFDVTVLQGGTAEEVADWLATNDYQSIPNAASILQDYVDQQFVFTAIKLTGGAQTTEIHPLVFKYVGNEPCVPIKLTAVAATEDMGVRTFFLGDDRVVPLNYKHLTLNPVRIDWNQFASNYTQVVSRGADSPVSNGQGFVTEFAGASSTVFQNGIYAPSWTSASFVGLAPELVIQTLNTMGLTQCFSGFCQFNHPLIRPLLNEYLPVPVGLDEAVFYGDLASYVDQIDPVAWDALAFSEDFAERIEEPGKHAIALLTKWPYLTRLFTTLSPTEMTLDPIFMPWPGLPPVQPYQQATRRTTCSGNSVMLLPDGREVALDSFGQWPPWDSQMPFVEEIEEYQADGDVVKLVDNTELIDAELLAWNKLRGWKGGGGNAGAGGNFATGGTGNGSGNPITNTASSSEAAGGCACGFRNESGSAVAILFGVGLVELLRRRRRYR
jgi:MYXO-CTERM domain-containing protein